MTLLTDDTVEQQLAPEMLLDENNPANDAYFSSLRSLRHLAISQSAKMTAKHVQVAKLAHQSLAKKDIAVKVRFTPSTVSAVLKRDDVQVLCEILSHMNHLIDGPNLDVRKNMLWRIAHHNEQMEPSVCLAALKELNKLAGSYPVQSIQQNTAINITINGKALPRTELDA